MNASVFFRVALLSAVLSVPVWLALRAVRFHVEPLLVFGFVITACSVALRWHFHFIHKLRLVHGEPDRALSHFRVWRFLLPLSSYELLRAQMLLQADRLDELSAEIAKLEPVLPEWMVHHLRAQEHKAKDRYEEAVASMERALSARPPIQYRAPYLVDLARMVAERVPSRMPEALAWLAEAKVLPVANDATRHAMTGMEGIVLVESGSYERGAELIEASLLTLPLQGRNAALLLGIRAELLRGLGRARWGLGEREEAQRLLSKARETTRADRLNRALDEDLARLSRGESLHEGRGAL